MAAIDFPSNPTTNEIFTSGSSVWQWDGVAWRVVRNLEPEAILSFSNIDLGNVTPTGVFSNASLMQAVVQAATPFVLNGLVATSSYTIPYGYSCVSAGPITVQSGVTITVASGSKWVVL